jgi:TolB-like protein/Flp pilus assembly protein TadD
MLGFLQNWEEAKIATERIQRRLAAILATDVVGYSRLMAADEAGTLAELGAIRRELIDPKIAEHGGRTVKLMGDGALVEFASVVDALECAVAIQLAMGKRNAAKPEDRRIVFRIGINVGDIIIEGDDIYGDGVNVAARLESLAEPGGICISSSVREQVLNKVPISFSDLGEQTVKNIERPIRVYYVLLEGASSASPPEVAVSQPAQAQRASIAVLPFANMSGDPEQEYFADGISEDIITALSKISGLFVIARNSSFTFKGKNVHVGEVGKKLGVRFILEGSVRKAGNRVRITAQLVDASSAGHIWAERYDRELTDVFAVQDEVTKEIVAALALNLTIGEEQQLTGEHTSSPEAYDSFLRGRELWHLQTKETNAEARVALQRAIELDPNFAPAYALLAITHMRDYLNQWSPSPSLSLEEGYKVAQEAVGRSDRDPYAHWALGSLYLWLRRHDEAERELRRAISLNPSFSLGYTLLGLTLHYSGGSEEALHYFERAIALDPYTDVYLHFQSQAYFQLGRYEKAVEVLKRRLTRHPDTDISRVLLAASFGHLGRTDEARAQWQEVFRINPKYSLEHRRKVLPYKNPSDFELVVQGLRKADIEP